MKPSFSRLLLGGGLLLVAWLVFALQQEQRKAAELRGTLSSIESEMRAKESRAGKQVATLQRALELQTRASEELHRLRGVAVTLGQLKDENEQLRTALARSTGSVTSAKEIAVLKDFIRNQAAQSAGSGEDLRHLPFDVFRIVAPERFITENTLVEFEARIAEGASNKELVSEFGIGSKHPSMIRKLQDRQALRSAGANP